MFHLSYFHIMILIIYREKKKEKEKKKSYPAHKAHFCGSFVCEFFIYLIFFFLTTNGEGEFEPKFSIKKTEQCH